MPTLTDVGAKSYMLIVGVDSFNLVKFQLVVK